MVSAGSKGWEVAVGRAGGWVISRWGSGGGGGLGGGEREREREQNPQHTCC